MRERKQMERGDLVQSKPTLCCSQSTTFWSNNILQWKLISHYFYSFFITYLQTTTIIWLFYILIFKTYVQFLKVILTAKVNEKLFGEGWLYRRNDLLVLDSPVDWVWSRQDYDTKRKLTKQFPKVLCIHLEVSLSFSTVFTKSLISPSP